MNRDDLAQISMLLDKKIKPVKDIVAMIHQRLGSIEVNAAYTFNQVRRMHELQSKINEELVKRLFALEKLLSEQQQTLDSQTASLVKIENTLGAYSDAYNWNKDQINEIRKHLGLP